MYIRWRSLNGDSMTLNVIDQVNSRLTFLHRQNRFLTPSVHRLLCNALIRSAFGYGCIIWFPNISKKLWLRLQTMQNKYLRFHLQLDKMSRICMKEFIELNWLNFHNKYLQFTVSGISKFTIISVLTSLMKFSALLTIMEYPSVLVTKNWNYSFVSRN